jgi:hypothetical protein
VTVQYRSLELCTLDILKNNVLLRRYSGHMEDENMTTENKVHPITCREDTEEE